jgi:hypothetical protein
VVLEAVEREKPAGFESVDCDVAAELPKLNPVDGVDAVVVGFDPVTHVVTANSTKFENEKKRIEHAIPVAEEEFGAVDPNENPVLVPETLLTTTHTTTTAMHQTLTHHRSSSLSSSSPPPSSPPSPMVLSLPELMSSQRKTMAQALLPCLPTDFMSTTRPRHAFKCVVFLHHLSLTQTRSLEHCNKYAYHQNSPHSFSLNETHLP